MLFKYRPDNHLARLTLFKYGTDNRSDSPDNRRYTIANTHDCLMLLEDGADNRRDSPDNTCECLMSFKYGADNRRDRSEYLGNGGFDSAQPPGFSA